MRRSTSVASAASGHLGHAGSYLSLTGRLAAADKFGRLRLLIVDHAVWCTLEKAIPEGVTPPYEKSFGDVYAVATITVPSHRRSFWLSRVEDLRGAQVTVDVGLRRWAYPDGARGIALDLRWLRETETPS